jgi:hypothetical protein
MQVVAGGGQTVGNTDGGSMKGITAMHTSVYIHEATSMNQFHGYIIKLFKKKTYSQ